MLGAALKSTRKGQPMVQWMRPCWPLVLLTSERRRMTKIRKKTHEQRTHIICLRLTDLELSILDEKAEKCRMTRSDFIRSLILSRKLMPKYEIVIDSKEIQALLAQYGKIGSNLNQIARYFNSGGEHSLSIQEEIERTISELYSLRKEVLKLAGDYIGSDQTHKKPQC